MDKQYRYLGALGGGIAFRRKGGAFGQSKVPLLDSEAAQQVGGQSAVLGDMWLDAAAGTVSGSAALTCIVTVASQSLARSSASIAAVVTLASAPVVRARATINALTTLSASSKSMSSAPIGGITTLTARADYANRASLTSLVTLSVASKALGASSVRSVSTLSASGAVGGTLLGASSLSSTCSLASNGTVSGGLSPSVMGGVGGYAHRRQVEAYRKAREARLKASSPTPEHPKVVIKQQINVVKQKQRVSRPIFDVFTIPKPETTPKKSVVEVEKPVEPQIQRTSATVRVARGTGFIVVFAGKGGAENGLAVSALGTCPILVHSGHSVVYAVQNLSDDEIELISALMHEPDDLIEV